MIPGLVAHLRLVPVEAVVLVVLDRRLVALMLRQSAPFAEDPIGLQFVAGDQPDDLFHVLGQHLPDLKNAHRRPQTVEICYIG